VLVAYYDKLHATVYVFNRATCDRGRHPRDSVCRVLVET